MSTTEENERLPGVRDPRPEKFKPKVVVDEPRKETNRDLLALERRRLRAGMQTPIQLKGGELTESGELTLRVYRFTRSIEIVNEDMGYGERLTERLWQPTSRGGETLKALNRMSQRTRTGRQHLEKAPEEEKTNNKEAEAKKPPAEGKGRSKTKARSKGSLPAKEKLPARKKKPPTR